MRRLHLQIIVRQGNEHGAAFAERILVDKHLILRHPGGQRVFDHTAHLDPTDRPSDGQERSSHGAEGEDWAHTWQEDTGDPPRQQAPTTANGETDQTAEHFAHKGAFRIHYGG
jgi:hypothetical protein